MNNAEQPSFPVPCQSRSNGLTKREYMAMTLMGEYIKSTDGTPTPNEAAKAGVMYADELLEQLSSPKP